MTSVRVALLTEIAAPFRIRPFNALAGEDGIELRVLFLSERDPKRPYPLLAREFRFGWRILGRWEVFRGGRWVVVNRGVLRELARFAPDVVIIGGWNQPAFWEALLYTRLRRRPLVAWVESTVRDARPDSRVLEITKRLLTRRCAAFIVPGRASADYLRALGVAPERIHVAPNAVDQDIFGARVAEAAQERERLRAELGVDGCCFLYVGRLDREKGVDLLIGALEDVPGELVVIGGGADEQRLHELAPGRVRFLGRLSREELVPWYAAADVFVLPSRSDQWGMVLNEAAAAGLPLVATEAPGAAHDLIEDGVNGFRVPVEDERALAAALRRLAEDADLRASARGRSLELARDFTPEAWARAVGELVRRLARQGRPRGGRAR